MKKNTTGYGAERPAWDRRDCSVRALASAAGVPYAQASAIFSAAGRALQRGTTIGTSKEVYERWLGMRPQVAKMQLAYFIALNPTGRFTLHKRGHAFALVDGVVWDWESTSGPGTFIEVAWEVTEETQARLARAAGLLG